METIINKPDYIYRQSLKVTESIVNATDEEQDVIDILTMSYKLLGLRFNLSSELRLEGLHKSL
jgi:hypothetical protein